MTTEELLKIIREASTQPPIDICIYTGNQGRLWFNMALKHELLGIKIKCNIPYTITDFKKIDTLLFNFVEKSGLWKGYIKNGWFNLYKGTTLITTTNNLKDIEKYINNENRASF